MGTYGRRGVGYEVKLLRELLENTLGLNREWRVMLVGAGNLGRALAGYAGFSSHGFRFVGVVDNNPDLVGMKIHDLEVSSFQRSSRSIVPTLPWSPFLGRLHSTWLMNWWKQESETSSPSRRYA